MLFSKDKPNGSQHDKLISADVLLNVDKTMVTPDAHESSVQSRFCHQSPVRYWFDTKSFHVVRFSFASRPKLTFSRIDKPMDPRFRMPGQPRKDELSFLEEDCLY